MSEQQALIGQDVPKSNRKRWTAVLVAGLLLVLLGRPKGIGRFGKEVIRGYESCYELGMYYADPVRLPHLYRTLQPDALACQGECAISSGCAHFTYWPDGGCLLTGPSSVLKAAPNARTLTGPRECPEGHSEMTTAGTQKMDPSVDGAWVPPVVLKHLQLVDGNARCDSHPACRKEQFPGKCCPNTEGIMLSCCEGVLPKVVQPLKGSCSAFPACVLSNLTGACCPTPAGVRLTCCESP